MFPREEDFHNNDPDPKNEFLGPNYLVRISTNSFRE